MFCGNCGTQTNGKENFCLKCGASIIVEKDSNISNDVSIAPEVMNCEKCLKPLRNVYGKGEFTEERICIECDVTPGKCPICNSNLNSEKAQQCLTCSKSWREAPLEGVLMKRSAVCIQNKIAKVKYKKDSGAEGAMGFMFVLGIIFILFGIFSSLLPFWVGFIIAMVFFGIGMIFSPKEELSVQGVFLQMCEDKGFKYKSNFFNEENGLFLGWSAEDGSIMIQFDNDGNTKNITIFVIKILKIELLADDNTLYKSGSIASLAGAAVGGLTFGGAGAIVGALTANKKGNGKINKVSLKLRLDSLDTPNVEIRFLDTATKASSSTAKNAITLAENWLDIIEVLRARISNKEMEHNKIQE